MLSWMYAVRKHCTEKLDRETAVEWVHGMENADGTTGPHWTMTETRALLEHRGGGVDPLAFWAAIFSANFLYSISALLNRGVQRVQVALPEGQHPQHNGDH